MNPIARHLYNDALVRNRWFATLISDWMEYFEITLRNCRKITDATCAGYFFEVKLLKQLSKNVGVAGYGEAF